jgi:hypothetical protein
MAGSTCLVYLWISDGMVEFAVKLLKARILRDDIRCATYSNAESI